MTTLPEASFDEIAVSLERYAADARRAVVAGEIILHRAGVDAPGTEHAMAELTRAAAVAEETYRLFRRLIPHEELVRDFLAVLIDMPTIARIKSGAGAEEAA